MDVSFLEELDFFYVRAGDMFNTCDITYTPPRFWKVLTTWSLLKLAMILGSSCSMDQYLWRLYYSCEWSSSESLSEHVQPQLWLRKSYWVVIEGASPGLPLELFLNCLPTFVYINLKLSVCYIELPLQQLYHLWLFCYAHLWTTQGES